MKIRSWNSKQNLSGNYWAKKPQKWFTRLKNMVFQEVPEELEECEFGCRQLHCSQGKWENCEGRKRTKS